MSEINDTICAVATGNNPGAIGVIRISGKDAKEIVANHFSRDLSNAESHKSYFGLFSLEGELIDEVLLTFFQTGKSYTGEETIEIACHGSRYIQEKILSALLKSGCRLAEPGEFTKRAFVNGKLDLSQAEAVADLIASSSKASHDLALRQLRGGLSNTLKELREKLINFASLVELELDFSEEDVEFADRKELVALVKEVLEYLEKTRDSFELGNAIKEGVPVAIVGAPNTGKSTLLNLLLGEDRAIVSDIAGTTRDVIEETINIGGILFRLIDTAGIRESEDVIESIGIERSKKSIDKAKVVICMADASDSKSLVEVDSWGDELKVTHQQKHILKVANKLDLSTEKGSDRFTNISAKSGEGVEELKNRLVASVEQGYDLENDLILTNLRHKEAMDKTIDSLMAAYNGLITGVSGDFVAMDIRQAMFHLGSITGEISTDDLLGNIFANFCIGK
ncbi:MAG: tRNA uridine-5-carboxymethylaminomethyl(34) synthesis GTPase MnmE [Crocinitomicaceae bacterium]